MRVLKMLKRSPLALDVYCWLTYRTYTLNLGRRPSVSIPWDSLQLQFGAGYPADTKQGQRNFKKAFIEQLKKIHALAYQDAKFELDEKGLTLFKSPPALPARPSGAKQSANGFSLVFFIQLSIAIVIRCY